MNQQQLLLDALQQGAWDDYFELLKKELSKYFDIKLLTISLIDMTNRKAKRLYSSNPSAYAIGGFKDIEDTYWTDTVLKQQQVFIGHTIERLAEFFFDHQLIASLGLGSVINWPIIFNQQVVGTINLLAEAGSYQDQDLSSLETLYPWLLIPLLSLD